ncbi:vomeronasal type-2 receptor 26-like [Rhinoderma darwinii]|uniref:vomeronasal type-2 receptor 26-like n=1 Tax=Rhinoderma darwinii TaxID=43563 RepID=UPI003F672AEB
MKARTKLNCQRPHITQHEELLGLVALNAMQTMMVLARTEDTTTVKKIPKQICRSMQVGYIHWTTDEEKHTDFSHRTAGSRKILAENLLPQFLHHNGQTSPPAASWLVAMSSHSPDAPVKELREQGCPNESAFLSSQGSYSTGIKKAGPHPREYIHILAFIFAIDEINKRPDILPNVTLGYHIYDSCGNVKKVIKDVLQILSGHKVTAPNYSCMEKDAVVGFIGDLYSVTTLPMAQLLNLYGYTQISYGAREPLLSDKKLYPNFFRTVPDDKMQFSALVKLLERFQWNWVGIITSDDDSGQQELQQLITQFTNHQICVEFSVLLSDKNSNIVPPALQASSTGVIIMCGSFNLVYIRFLFNAIHVLSNKTLILPSSWSLKEELILCIENEVPANCSLVFSLPMNNIAGMREFLSSIQLSSRPNDMLLLDIWMLVFHCLSGNKDKDFLLPMMYDDPFQNCTEEKRFTTEFYHPQDTTPYHVYKAVYIMAQALHEMNIFLNNGKHKISKIYDYKRKLTKYIKEGGFSFNENGDWITPLNLYNLLVIGCSDSPTMMLRTIGRIDASLPEDKQLQIKPQIVTWRKNSIPKGRCSEPCLPGTRKVLQEGYHICCYNCISCSEGEFTDHFDSENCQRCPEDKWSNEGKNNCVVRDYEFLSYENDVLSLVFSTISIFFSLITVFVIGIFTLFRNNPIVRANNRNLSFILLYCLMFSLLCVFLFMGRPVDITCMLRQICFGIFFTVVVSSVLAKTIIVCIAFKATRPNSSWRKCVGVKLPYSVVLICSSIQVLNSLIWLSIAPPYKEFNLEYSSKIIIQCNEGSVLAFYLMLGYMGFLAALSFVLAFMVRTLPDIYNEAKYITFSMLVFCSVWICAIPAYLSSTGKHMVTVEIFAILASGGGILSCMFLPKCYNIFTKPEVNSKGHVLHRHVM